MAGRDETSWVTVLLAWVAGGVDAVGYIVLLHLFTAHMSGNSVAMGAWIGQSRWGDAFRRGFPLPMFILGVGVGAAITEVAIRRGRRRLFAPALAVEAVLLIAFAAIAANAGTDGRVDPNRWTFYLATAFPAAAMGVQNGVLRRMSRRSKGMTYVTGLLTNLTEDLVALVFHVRDRLRTLGLAEAVRTAADAPALGRFAFSTSIFAGYTAGAVLGGLTQHAWHFFAVTSPIAGLVVLIVRDVVSPLRGDAID